MGQDADAVPSDVRDHVLSEAVDFHGGEERMVQAEVHGRNPCTSEQSEGDVVLEGGKFERG